MSTLRSRTKRRAFSDKPRDRGYIEDYGDDETSVTKASKRTFSLTALRYYCTPTTIAAVTVVSCLLSIQFVDIVLVQIASVSTIITSIILAYQQRILKRLVSLRHQHNEVRKRLNYFRTERAKLHRTMDRLDEQAADLHFVPKELQQLSKSQDVDQLLEILEEQKSIQEKMREKINQQVMQDIMSIVVRSDRDRNWTLRPNEVETLIVRLGGLEQIDLNERRFRQILGTNPTLGNVMEVIRSLLERDDEYQYGDPVFKVKL